MTSHHWGQSGARLPVRHSVVQTTLGSAIIFALCCLTILSQSASAGPLRDRLKERIAGRQQVNASHDVEEAGMGTRKKFALPAGAILKTDIAYGSDVAQRMDVYIPPNTQNAAVIFMVHGGGWQHGDKAINRVVENKAKRWLSKGIIFCLH